MTFQSAIDLLDNVRGRLAEHFDAVQINVSWLNPDGTTSIQHRGSGNYYARIGMAADFCNKEQAEVLADEIAKDDMI